MSLLSSVNHKDNQIFIIEIQNGYMPAKVAGCLSNDFAQLGCFILRDNIAIFISLSKDFNRRFKHLFVVLPSAN